MIGTADLLRTIRLGGSPATRAASELLVRAEAGAVAPAELAEAKQLINANPELRDVFGGARLRNLSERLPPTRDVNSLLPNFKQLLDAAALPGRFGADLTLLRQELTGRAGLTTEDQASRLFEFFSRYAEHLASLAQGQVPNQTQLSADQLARAREAFQAVLTQAKFAELRDPSGRTGLELADALLNASSADEVRELSTQLSLDAPGWSNVPHELPRADPTKRAPPPPAPTLRDEPPEAPPPPSRRTTNKVLGSNLLWNVLHKLRGDVEQEDRMNDLAVAAGLLLLFIGLVVGILVWAL